MHRRQRQITVAQAVAECHPGPGDLRAVVELHRGFDTETAAADFDGTVFAHQARTIATTIDADQRPVILFADEGARQVAARRIGAQTRQHRIEIWPFFRAAQRDLRAVHLHHAAQQLDPQVTGLALGQEQRVEPAIAAAHAAQQLPAARVGGRQQVVVETADTRRPAQDDTVEFAFLAEVDRQRARAHLQQRLGPRLRLGCALDELQARNAQRALAALATRSDDELDELGLAQRSVGPRSPGEFNVPALDLQVGQRGWPAGVRPVHPPDVVVAGIDQLELKVVDRARPFDARQQIEALGPDHGQGPPHHGVTGDAGEVDVQAQAAVAVAPQAGTHLVGGRGLPRRGVAKVVEHRHPQRRGLHGRRSPQQQACPQWRPACLHCLTLPIISPCM